MAGNSNLHDSIRNKQDEFYTEIGMIEQELKNYKDHFKNNVVFCNCDDPYESNFFKYFVLNFDVLGLKKLICTCFNGSQIAGTQISLFEDKNEEKNIPAGTAYKIELDHVQDMNGDGAITLEDVELMLRRMVVPKKLKGDGDFRSKECVKLLKESDIVVTNPPFSLFSIYFEQLIEYKKKFLIVGNLNNITFTNIIPHIINGDVWLGKSSGHFWFRVPSYYEEKKTDFKIDENGQKWRRMGNICWFTNLDYPARHEDMILYKHYDPEQYPKYDGFDAIDVKLVKDIPLDYYGIMGIPITGMNKISPEQFEVLGKIDSGKITEYNIANPIINGKSGYKRIAIRRVVHED